MTTPVSTATSLPDAAIKLPAVPTAPNGVTNGGNPSVAVQAAAEVGRLAGFLESQKTAFLADLAAGNGKGWIVVMGNEAGASSIAYASLASSLLELRVVPLSLTPASLMMLRPENILVFKNAQVPLSVLLHPENLPIPTSELASLGVRFALVDHNRLLPEFGSSGTTEGLVQAVIDHHDDEGLYKDAEIRVIKVPTGSASSLVTQHFMPQWQAALSSPEGQAGSPVPNELAILLLSAQLIDTHGLKQKEGGKATPTDFEAASFLYPLTPWSAASSDTATSLSTLVPAPLKEQNDLLTKAKFNVSYLSTHDLLLRDYKEYNLPTASTAFPTLRVGLSTVPLGLKDWLEKEGDWPMYLAAADQFTQERKLDIEGVLTSFKNKKGKSKREILLLVRVGGALDDAAAKKVIAELDLGLTANVELGLEPWGKTGFKRFLQRKKRVGLDGKSRYGRVWTQGNAGATRKKVAPIMRDLVAKLQ